MPAVSGAGTPSPLPMPIIATPIVAIVDHDDPVERDIIEHTKSVARGKILGFKIDKP